MSLVVMGMILVKLVYSTRIENALTGENLDEIDLDVHSLNSLRQEIALCLDNQFSIFSLIYEDDFDLIYEDEFGTDLRFLDRRGVIKVLFRPSQAWEEKTKRDDPNIAEQFEGEYWEEKRVLNYQIQRTSNQYIVKGYGNTTLRFVNIQNCTIPTNEGEILFADHTVPITVTARNGKEYALVSGKVNPDNKDKMSLIFINELRQKIRAQYMKKGDEFEFENWMDMKLKKAIVVKVIDQMNC